MIYLARHGQTDSNVSHVWQGQSGNDFLNREGKAQAGKLAKYLSNKDISKVYTSPLNRTFETASIVSEKLGLEVEKDKLLLEMSYGDFEGLTNNKILIKYLDLYHKWKKDPRGTQFPDGESFSDLMERANKVVKKYLHSKENILLVSHEDAIRAIIVAVSKKVQDFWLPNVSNTSVTVFRNDLGNVKIVSVGQLPT